MSSYRTGSSRRHGGTYAANPFSAPIKADSDVPTDDPRVRTITGVPLGADEVIVGRGTSREIVLTQRTLDVGAGGRSRFTQSYADSAVESDFIAFSHRSRAPLFIYVIVDSLIGLTTINIIPIEASMLRLALNAVILLLAIIATDRFTAFVSRRCTATPLCRTDRARLHEALFGLYLVSSLFHTLMEGYNKDIVDCSPTRAAASDAFTPSPPPALATTTAAAAAATTTAVASTTAAAAAVSQVCHTVGFGDFFRMGFVIVIAPPRTKILCIALTIVVALMLVVQYVDLFGGAFPGYYNVSTGELASRTIVTLLEAVCSVVIVFPLEHRLRDHYEGVVDHVATVLERRLLLQQLRALRRCVVRNAAGASDAQAPVRSHSMSSRSAPISARCLPTPRAAVVVSPATSGVVTAMWAEVRAPVIFGRAGSPRASAQTSVLDVLEAHFVALNGVLELLDVPPGVRTWCMGDAVVAVGCVHDASISPGGTDGATLTEHEPDDQGNSTTGGAAVADAADGEARLKIQALSVCYTAASVHASVLRVRATTPEWTASDVAVRIGVATRSSDAILTEDVGHAAEAGSACRDARRVASLDAPSGAVLVTPATMSLVRDVFSHHATHDSADGARVYGLSAPNPTARPQATLPLNPETDAPPSTLAEAVLEDAAVYGPAGGDDDEDLGERVDLSLRTTSWCHCCGCCEGWGCGVLQACFPKFAEATIEEGFQRDDDLRMLPNIAATVIVAIVTLVAAIALLLVSNADNTSVAAVVCAVGVIALSPALVISFNVKHAAITAAKRLAAIGFILIVAVSCVAAATSLARTSHAALVVALLIAPVHLAVKLHLPEHLALRLASMTLVTLTAWALALAHVPKGRELALLYYPFGIIFDVCISSLYSRSRRVQYCDLRSLTTMRHEVVEARVVMDAALARHVPPFVTAALRSEPRLPMCRPFVLPAVPVVIVDFNVARLVAAHSITSLSQFGSFSQHHDSGTSVLRGIGSAHGSAGPSSVASIPTPVPRRGGGAAAAVAAVEDQMALAFRRFSTRLPGCFVQVHGDALVGAGVADGAECADEVACSMRPIALVAAVCDVLDAVAPAAEGVSSAEIPSLAGATGEAPSSEVSSPPPPSAVALGGGVVEAPMLAPLTMPTELTPLACNELAFPPGSRALVRCATHRAPAVAGLCGSLHRSFCVSGPALAAATQLARSPLAVGALVVSEAADSRVPCTHIVHNLGRVGAIPLRRGVMVRSAVRGSSRPSGSRASGSVVTRDAVTEGSS